jgi:hypothetical protein
MNNEMTVEKDELFAVSAKMQNCLELFNLAIMRAKDIEAESPEAGQLLAAMCGIKDYMTSIDKEVESLC